MIPFGREWSSYELANKNAEGNRRKLRNFWIILISTLRRSSATVVAHAIRWTERKNATYVFGSALIDWTEDTNSIGVIRKATSQLNTKYDGVNIKPI